MASFRKKRPSDLTNSPIAWQALSCLCAVMDVIQGQRPM